MFASAGMMVGSAFLKNAMILATSLALISSLELTARIGSQLPGVSMTEERMPLKNGGILTLKSMLPGLLVAATMS